ncbi:MAG: hypothetical protein RBT37_09855 [Dissulfurispiraceae bacterium]|jgi:hypothetical protein|nr:hypothetical protein [Dissulfurispiraceae bacterium]
MESRKVINKIFNIALFLYFLLNSCIGYLFDPMGNKLVPWDKVYAWSPTFGILGALVLLIISAMLGAVIANIFWNRFISDVFNIRRITFDESLALVLIIAIMTI